MSKKSRLARRHEYFLEDYNKPVSSILGWDLELDGVSYGLTHIGYQYIARKDDMEAIVLRSFPYEEGDVETGLYSDKLDDVIQLAKDLKRWRKGAIVNIIM